MIESYNLATQPGPSSELYLLILPVPALLTVTEISTLSIDLSFPECLLIGFIWYIAF